MLHMDIDVLAFRHELARRAVLEAINPTRRLVIHREVLAALRADPRGARDLARLAHHAEAAGDQASTLTYATAAAREAVTLSAHREAAAQLARALRVAGSADPVRRARVLEEYARECHTTGQHEEALRASQQAITIWRAEGNQHREGENLSSLAAQFSMVGQNAAAENASRESLAILEALPPSPELASAYRQHAHLRMLNRDTTEAIGWGLRAIALAERFKSQETLIGAYNSVGSAMLVAGNSEGREYLERSHELARVAGLHDLAALALGNLGSALGEQYQFDLAGRYLDDGIAYSTEHDIDRHRLYMLAWQALCRMYQGRWNEATDLALRVTTYPSSSAISRNMASVAIGRVRARRGDPEVGAVLDEALKVAAPTETVQRLAPVRAARAEAASLLGDLARASDEAGAAFDMAVRQGHAWFTSELGYWMWRAGERVDLSAYRTNPFALQVAGDWMSAAARWEEIGCPYEAARALGESDDEDAMRTALARFEHLGAQPMAHIIARRLRERGARAIPRGPRPATRAHPAGLTQREVEILGLLAIDLRNAEIAARLSLAPKTVEHHVSSILSKLGARTRTEAVRLAADRALIPQNGGRAAPK
jgi:DNA-binding CsgD family transcriptional regulator